MYLSITVIQIFEYLSLFVVKRVKIRFRRFDLFGIGGLSLPFCADRAPLFLIRMCFNRINIRKFKRSAFKFLCCTFVNQSDSVIQFLRINTFIFFGYVLIRGYQFCAVLYQIVRQACVFVARLPGTANKSRFESIAHPAVSFVPLLCSPSIITTPFDNPTIIRLRSL